MDNNLIEEISDILVMRFKQGVNSAYIMGQEDMKHESIQAIGNLVGPIVHDSFGACMAEATKVIDELPIADIEAPSERVDG